MNVLHVVNVSVLQQLKEHSHYAASLQDCDCLLAPTWRLDDVQMWCTTYPACVNVLHKLMQHVSSVHVVYWQV